MRPWRTSWLIVGTKTLLLSVVMIGLGRRRPAGPASPVARAAADGDRSSGWCGRDGSRRTRRGRTPPEATKAECISGPKSVSNAQPGRPDGSPTGPRSTPRTGLGGRPLRRSATRAVGVGLVVLVGAVLGRRGTGWLAVARRRAAGDRRRQGEPGRLVVGGAGLAVLEERVVLGCRGPRAPRRRGPRGPPGARAPCGPRRSPAHPSRPG